MTSVWYFRRGVFPPDVFLAIMMLAAVSHVVDLHDEMDGTQDRDCSKAFHFLHDIYKSCAPTATITTNGKDIGVDQLKKVTGADILVVLQKMCSSRVRMAKCRDVALEGCPSSLVKTYQKAVDVSMWFCDNEDNIRGPVTRALIGSSSAPENEHEKSSCLPEGTPLDNCTEKVLNLVQYRSIRNYGDVIRHDAEEVLKDSLTVQYFGDLFACEFKILHRKCPHNAIPMVLSSAPHFISPPKFGINFTDLILHFDKKMKK